ncbi:MAG: monofunctional biosynthetic peptidoglycan transglycosylase [Deltaproteobacteria bacterium]|nr:monofunctional biosynthetic peptidoglycan transglycosylase [Deltaproteobacteria bacterium]
MLKFLLKLIKYFVGLSILWVLAFRWLPIPATPLMVIRSLEQKQAKQKVIWQHDWVSLENISKNLQRAVICSEDQKFLEHQGFDLKAITAALKHNQKGKKLRGGSTISQQTAKNVFLWPHRSWLRKGLEVYFTFLIEITWPKERILEVYLNSIEMGPGIYGAEAAAQYWFKKSAQELSPSEAAAIAAILPNPRKYKAQPPTSYIQKRKQWIIKQMNYYRDLEF